MADPMSNGWYYLKSGAPADQQTGPLTWEALYALASSGALLPADQLWHPTMPAWMPAGSVPALFPAQAPAGLQPWATAPVPQPAPYQYTQSAPATSRSGGPSRMLAWLIPLIALVLVGGGLGAYFGLTRGDDNGQEANGGGGAITTSTAGEETSGADLGAIEIVLPDPAKLIQSATYGEVPANQIGIVLADGKNRDDAEDVAAALGGTVVGELEYLNAYQVETPGTTEADLQAALDQAAAIAGVEIAFPNQQTYSDEEIWGVRHSPLNDPMYGGDNGGGYDLIGVQNAWDYINGSGLELSGVQVGVVDDGLYKGTREFDGDVNITYPDPNAGELSKPEKGDDGYDDPTGSHGTAVAGIIGADPKNGGMVGVASNLGDKLTIAVINKFTPPYGSASETTADPNDPSKVTLATGKSYSIGSLAAMLKQVQAGSKVINCSFGADKPDPSNAALARLYRKFFEKMAVDHPDVTFVCAAGNEGRNGVPLSQSNYYPAGAGSGLPNVITVGNVVNDGQKWESSNTAGPDGEVTLAAPGHQAVQGAFADGEVVNEYGGTSMAAPQVAAAAALLISLDPTLTAARVKEILAGTAQPGPAELGGKILSVDAAVLQVINDVRRRNGMEALTAEDLQNGGVVDAVAVSTDTPGVYTIKGIAKAVPHDGVFLEISAGEGVSLSDESYQKLNAPGEAEMCTATISSGETENEEEMTITVTRSDNGASSVISFAKYDINGHWTGTLTFTDITFIDTGGASDSGGSESGLEGCDMSGLAEAIEALKNYPLPMTLDIEVDENGAGTAVLILNTTSLQTGTDSASGEQEPLTLPVTYAGRTLTMELTQEGDTVTFTGTVSKQGDTLVINGTMSGSGPSMTLAGIWTATKTE